MVTAGVDNELKIISYFVNGMMFDKNNKNILIITTKCTKLCLPVYYYVLFYGYDEITLVYITYYMSTVWRLVLHKGIIIIF